MKSLEQDIEYEEIKSIDKFFNIAIPQQLGNGTCSILNILPSSLVE